MKQSNSVTRGMGTAVFGLAAIGAAAPVLANIGGTYLGSKFINTGIDFTSQMVANGGHLDDINLTSLATSFVFNKTTSLKGLFFKNTIANGLQVNSGEGYQGFGGEGVSNSNVFGNILAGTAFDKASSALQKLNGSVTPATLGRWKNLAYKPKYAQMLQRYKRNLNISNFFKSPATQVVTGAANNEVSKDAKVDNQ